MWYTCVLDGFVDNAFVCGVCTPGGAHLNTPQACVDKRYAGMGDEQEVASGRSLRVRKVVKPCPTCKTDISDFLRTAQVNRYVYGVGVGWGVGGIVCGGWGGVLFWVGICNVYWGLMLLTQTLT